MNKKAFSMIEILISVSIIIILAIVATTTSNNLKNNSNNSKVVSDLNTIENSLVSFKEQSGSLPLPNGNNNFFDKNGSYVHSFTSTGAFGVYGKFTENSLEKRFLDITPLDPRTNQYYSYGLTKDSNQFEIAGVIGEKDNYISKIVGDYTAEDGLYSIIREYNGANFISDKSTNLPYNPEEKVLIATDTNGNIYKKGDTINNNTGNNLEIFFSDGSTSIITPGTIINLNELDFPKENNLVSKINLFLQAGSIWTKATRLGEESSFDIVTSDTTASVRGTIFKVEVLANSSTEVHVIEGKVEVIDNRNNIAIPIEVLEGEPQKTKNSTKTIIEDVTNPVITEELFPIHFLDNSLATGTITEVIKEKIEIDHEIKDCYLEDQLVRNGETASGFLNKKSESCQSEERTCDNGILYGPADFKYASCEPIICQSFEIAGVCQDNENNLKNDGWNLYAYAPYNSDGDIKLYNRDNNINIVHDYILFNPNCGGGVIGNCDNNNPVYAGATYKNRHNSYVEFGSTKGVFIDTGGGDDYIKYKDLDLGGDFAIEMRVKIVSATTSRFLFDFNDTLKAYISTTNKLQIKNSNFIFTNVNIPTDGEFHTIVLKKEGNNYSLSINNSTPTNNINTNPINNNLYIGSNKDKLYQLNNIIDYVKIYKK